MAVEGIERMTIVAHRDIHDQVVDALARLGTFHVDRICGDEELACREQTEEEAEEIRFNAFDLSKVEFLIRFLSEHREKKPGFMATMIKPKHYLSFDEFSWAPARIDFEKIYSECSVVERRLVVFAERRGRLEQELTELEYWKELELPMSEIKGEYEFRVVALRIDPKELEETTDELAVEAPESSLEVISDDEEWAACLLVHHPDAGDAVAAVLGRHEVERVEFRDLDEEPLERLEQVRREIAAIDHRQVGLAEEIKGYQKYLPDLEIIKEFLLNKRRHLEIRRDFGATKATVVIDGWVTESGVSRTTETVKGLSEDIVVETRDPEPDENPPVSLRNRGWLKPFEMLTRLYGVPNRREYDPTWLVAISFMLFFGFCIGDVGYGVVIIAAFLLMRRYLPLGKSARDLLLVMVYGGAFAIIFGVLTGSWFGYDPAKLPSFMRSMQVFDPLEDPIPVMLVCMVIGILHMLSGTIVEMRDNLKGGNIADAMIDQGLVILLIAGGGTAGVLVAVGLLPSWVIFLVAAVAIGGMIILGGHKNKSLPGKMFGGLYETYNTVVGWLGDTVSYLRLFALGLATFAVAWVINILANMAKGIAPIVGILLMVIIILVGHTFNVAVNLLSAFVHPLRLEYVEFFGKFYEDGGRGFRPFGIESSTVIIKDET